MPTPKRIRADAARLGIQTIRDGVQRHAQLIDPLPEPVDRPLELVQHLS